MSNSDLNQFINDFMRNSIGFDYLLNSRNHTKPGTSNFPPHDIIKLSDNIWQLHFALAGYSQEDVEVKQVENELVVQSAKDMSDLAPKEDNSTQYLYKGIAKRSFKQRIMLSDNVHVKQAIFENGLLLIILEKQVPKKVERIIEIQ